MEKRNNNQNNGSTTPGQKPLKTVPSTNGKEFASKTVPFSATNDHPPEKADEQLPDTQDHEQIFPRVPNKDTFRPGG